MSKVLLLVEDAQIEQKIQSLLGSFESEFSKIKQIKDFHFHSLKLNSENPQVNSLRKIKARRYFLFQIGKTLFVNKCFWHRLKRELLGNVRPRSFYGFRVQIRTLFSLSFILDLISVAKGISASWIPALEKFLQEKIDINTELECILEQELPSLVVIFTSSYEPLLLEVSLIKRIHRFKTLVVLNNWDNPTSKSLLPTNIDFVATWNKEQIESLVEIHRFNLKKLFVLGSVQSDHYIDMEPIKNTRNRKLLFLGQQNSYDEKGEVSKIRGWIDSGQIPFESITYRPHPNSKAKWKRLEEFTSLNKIILDRSRFPEWAKYDVVVSLPTTLLLEALSFHDSVLVYVPRNGIFRTNPGEMWFKYEHFSTLRKQTGLKQALDSQELLGYLRDPFRSGVDQQALENLFPIYKMRYAHRLARLIEEITP